MVWRCFCGGGVVVSTSGPRTRMFRCFAPLWWCGGVVVWWCLRCVYVEQRCSGRCVMCGTSRQQLADTKDALVRGITTLYNRHVTNWPMGNSHQQLADNKDVLVRGITTL